MSSLTCPSRLLGRSVLQHRTTACCSFRAPTIYVRHKYTLTSLTGNLRTKWALRNPPSLNPSIVRQFTYSAPWNATHLDRQIPRGRPKPSSRSWIDNLPPSVVFWSIFAVNAGVFIAWYYAENNYTMFRDSRHYKWMIQNFTVSVDNLKSGRIWTILTCCFSQAEVSHLLFNGFTYFFMARPVLSMLGNTQFLILYLGGGLIANTTSVLWNQDLPHHSSHGASGALYAIISYFACREPFTKFLLFAIVPIPAWTFVPGVILYDVYRTVASNRKTRIDTAGHVGGVFAGIAYFLSRRAGIRL